MDSSLSPREIQTRIRAGESLAEVALAAGVPTDDIEGYAGPVLAEREHAASLAASCQVRRRGEPSAHRSLAEAAAQRLGDQEPHWDAWRDEQRSDRHWTVAASWHAGGEDRRALFDFDPRGRYSIADNDEAHWLIGDIRTSTTGGWRPAPDPDVEPTVDLDDEMALVRAVQDAGATTPLAQLTETAEFVKESQGERHGGGQTSQGEDAEPQDYSDAELTEVNGVYDIVSNPHSDMDVLYEMLSTFDEDSVNIYTGLTRPVIPAPADATDESTEQTPAAAQANQPAPSPRLDSTPTQSPAPTPAGQPAPIDKTVYGAPSPKSPTRRSNPTQIQRPQTDEQPVAAPTRPTSGDAAGPTQDALVDDPTPAPGHRKPKARQKKRASVPSWDEIMFGGPRTSNRD